MRHHTPTNACYGRTTTTTATRTRTHKGHRSGAHILELPTKHVENNVKTETTTTTTIRVLFQNNEAPILSGEKFTGPPLNPWSPGVERNIGFLCTM